jgi:hypothetical protein
MTNQMPATLDNKKLHSPSEVRKWKQDMANYFAAQRAAEDAARRQEEADKAHANRILSDEEYYQQAIEQNNQRREKELERQAAAYAEEQERQAYLASRPDTVHISEVNEATFLRMLEHWINAGYAIDHDGMIYFQPRCYSLNLLKQEKKTGKGSSK